MTDERRLFLHADGKWTLDNESRTGVGQCADAPGSLILHGSLHPAILRRLSKQERARPTNRNDMDIELYRRIAANMNMT